MGNFCLFFLTFLKVHSSTLDEIKTRAYIKILRHPSLAMHLSNMYSNFHDCNFDKKRDIHVQKMYMKKIVFSNFQHI